MPYIQHLTLLYYHLVWTFRSIYAAVFEILFSKQIVFIGVSLPEEED